MPPDFAKRILEVRGKLGLTQIQEVIASGVLNFPCRPDVVASVVEAERLGFGHLANPGFAAELALINPLPPPADCGL